MTSPRVALLRSNKRLEDLFSYLKKKNKKMAQLLSCEKSQRQNPEAESSTNWESVSDLTGSANLIAGELLTLLTGAYSSNKTLKPWISFKLGQRAGTVETSDNHRDGSLEAHWRHLTHQVDESLSRVRNRHLSESGTSCPFVRRSWLPGMTSRWRNSTGPWYHFR